MKINLTVEVTNELRRAIARDYEHAVATLDGLATHASVKGWIDEQIHQCENAIESWIEPEHVTDEEKADAKQAIGYLRTAGWDDERIVHWLIAQRAYRLHLRKAIAAEVIPFRPRA